MAKVIGGKRHTAHLRRMASAAKDSAITRALFVGGNEIQVEAQHSITAGAVSGAGHVASSPGEPPNADTHALDRQIETTVQRPRLVHVTSNDPKSIFLEVGTSKMAARPFMTPAAEKLRRRVSALVAQAVSRFNAARG